MDLDDTLQGSTIPPEVARESNHAPTRRDRAGAALANLLARPGDGFLAEYIVAVIELEGQKAIASAIGRSVERVSKIKDRTSGASLETLESLLKACGLKCVPIESQVVSQSFLNRAEMTERLLAQYMAEKFGGTQ